MNISKPNVPSSWDLRASEARLVIQNMGFYQVNNLKVLLQIHYKNQIGPIKSWFHRPRYYNMTPLEYIQYAGKDAYTTFKKDLLDD